MLFEIDIADAPTRFAELIETIDAGYGVLIKRGDEIVCRLVRKALLRSRLRKTMMTGSPLSSVTPRMCWAPSSR